MYIFLDTVIFGRVPSDSLREVFLKLLLLPWLKIMESAHLDKKK